MNKMAFVLVELLMVFSLATCGSASSSSPSTSENPATVDSASSEAGKTLVVYYSATGNTKRVAGFIATSTGADLFALKPADPYTENDLNYRDKGSRVSREHDNEHERDVELLSVSVDDWDSYDTVFIGYPLWWGIAAWPIDGFIGANDFTGKTVIPFCTSAASGLGESGELLRKAAGNGNWLEGRRFSSGVKEEEIQAWIEGLGL